MDFWSEFTKTITNAADQTVKGTEKLTNIAKLKYRLSSLSNKQNECFQNIGRLRFAEFSGESVTPDMYEGLFAEAAELNAQIKECENKLYDLQDYTCCPQCGNKAQKGMSFCPKCGAALQKDKES
jgi:hypothetical protein